MTKKSVSETVVSDRAQHFLKALIERYIRDGQPVGSRTLAKDTGLDLSPATIRNVMADLEDMGLVSSPHTSAGRVPTITGYRMFIDSLLTVQDLNNQQVEKIRNQLMMGGGENADVLKSASKLLSGVTHMAGVVTLTRRDKTTFRQIEFLPLSDRRVLAILVTEDGEVHNRILHTHRDFDRVELDQAANFLNKSFAGFDMEVVRQRVLQQLNDAREHFDQVMTNALTMAGEIVNASESKEDCVIAGQTNLMEFAELSGLEQLRKLFDAFTEKREILHLLDQFLDAEGVQIFIGEESGYQLLNGCSVVTAPYQVNEEVVGVLGVIGPTRMDYERVIPVVDITAKILGAVLKKH
ncbi:MAG: heat-inducible transcriptional repressor HrcA [gamma proteobacterium symbiont of Ctena orbiculata]|uniref:Heat-inducible transcription repressor HrcA n=1 Tax=Candidatus Thiodiazotropha taylori TaxID=2792791 RepID=A0A944QW45_9GAMM|nr:heat-inducible transcriptional repressor HrcA [Candidatus Thiodiazotropha taylori]PUB87410.1 MAG: heat-inducible transcriptional repressor HrcA [gamma proteobacterium symbiont of Ctena orbiculata]MBT2990664.1 heat-inducible transcriptional repressor HrcA [Candidatus Thiodiazotropha taylori]MBT2996852.1 heat-inducible transcriptional repressor HrcA [Candidatus Thiodiazotropha taylori]MBT3002085.1 heat-inducible transcriptional repressor HrcA [Candidatus Thiodiazotropha taylori]